MADRSFRRRRTPIIDAPVNQPIGQQPRSLTGRFTRVKALQSRGDGRPGGTKKSWAPDLVRLLVKPRPPRNDPAAVQEDILKVAHGPRIRPVATPQLLDGGRQSEALADLAEEHLSVRTTIPAKTDQPADRPDLQTALVGKLLNPHPERLV
ncbi:hypothetical protein ABZ860_08645 [Microbispora sp. NPDC046973]|uniref:hypothetical protein n=1 Tax=Microbispora sp. NPDC046973 TaxID=3155022 RepID=UPI0033FBE95D